MKTLINYPHGLGDCLMLTPALREYYNNNEKLDIAIMKRFKSSQIFDHCPYIDNIYFVSDPWNDFKNPNIGFKKVQEEAREIAEKNNINNVKFLDHPPPKHKMYLNAQQLGLNLILTKKEIFTTQQDVETANKVIKDNIGNQPFGFIQTTTGAGPNKDLPEGFAKKWLKKHKNLHSFIEIGETFKYNDYNINVQFEILRQAEAICIPDSVFYHAASAMNKNIDFVYFGRGNSAYSRVKNLNNDITENIYYKIPYI